MKKFIIMFAAVLVGCLMCGGAFAKAPKQTAEVTFRVNLHCHKCVEKVLDNISYEKGVEDVDINEEQKTVRLVYNPKKTSVEKLQKALLKLGYGADVIEPAPEGKDGGSDEKCVYL